MSVHDGLRIGEQLAEAGYEPARNPEEADVVVLTTCSVREKARQKVHSAIGRFKRLKDRRPGLVVVVAGCVAQQDGPALLRAAPHVDAVLGPDHLGSLAELVEALRSCRQPVCRVGFDDGGPGSFLPVSRNGRPAASAFVTVQKGCDERCAFCIVPSVQGPTRCRPPGAVLETVGRLVDRGAREVVLLGQTVNGYHSESFGFAELLALIDRVPGLARVRYESAHPKLLSPALVEAHACLATLCEHLHLPVQSGSDPVLERMGRGHSCGDYVRWIDAVRRARPGVTFSTDLVVGFPGETEQDFGRTLELVERVRFSSSFSFKYSPRPGTPAAAWEDDVPTEVKEERLARLHVLQERLTAEALAATVGDEVEVLVEGASRAGGGQLRGRTRNNVVVNIEAPLPGAGEASAEALPGRLVRVRVGEAGKHSVRGCLVGAGGQRARGGERCQPSR